MNRPFLTSVILGSLMLVSAGLCQVMAPTEFMSESRPKVKFANIIPDEFGEWKKEDIQSALIINPQQEAVLKQTYEETLSRTYVNGKGDHVMLSIAYGTDQRRGNDVHYPESCYPAQGFEVMSLQKGMLATSQGSIAVTRLETNLSKQRYEPVTYWTTIGDDVTTDVDVKRMKELSYGVKGIIPDGLLFRVSSIDRNTTHAYAVQDEFVSSLVSKLSPVNKKRLTGLL